MIHRLAEVGKLSMPKMHEKYETGQFFLHRVFGYRGVILFPWRAKIYDRNTYAPTYAESPTANTSVNTNEADTSSSSSTDDTLSANSGLKQSGRSVRKMESTESTWPVTKTREIRISRRKENVQIVNTIVCCWDPFIWNLARGGVSFRSFVLFFWIIFHCLQIAIAPNSLSNGTTFEFIICIWMIYSLVCAASAVCTFHCYKQLIINHIRNEFWFSYLHFCLWREQELTRISMALTSFLLYMIKNGAIQWNRRFEIAELNGKWFVNTLIAVMCLDRSVYRVTMRRKNMLYF